jgi:5-formyltetrahydrofolate cyclo-ligase
MDIGEQKRTLRHQLTQRRDHLSPSKREQAAQTVVTRIASLADYQRADTVLTYMSFGSELSTADLVQRILQDGKQLVLPRMVGKRLTLHRVSDPETDTVPGCWGIPEPTANLKEVAARDISLFLLPGLGFDIDGGRIGYGRGFFDRLLADSNGIRAGIGYDEQLLPAVPMAPWDQRLNWVITPSETRRCQQ